MSRNSLFYHSVDSPSPPRSKPPVCEGRLSSAQRLSNSFRLPSQGSAKERFERGHSKRLSFGRMSLEERASEEQRIRTDASIDVRVFLEPEYRLGEGRTSEVYLGAYHPHDQAGPRVTWELCAVKRVDADRESQLAGLEEAFALRRLGPHPHIVQLITVLDELRWRSDAPSTSNDAPSVPNGGPPRLLIVLEYLPISLASFMERQRQSVHLLQWITWAIELASTVEWLHARGCVHGDIKMHNVLLTSDLHVKLCDFSSVLFSNAAVPMRDCYSVGTPAFRAPELFTLGQASSIEAGAAHPALSYTLDIFSLGVVFYFLATGVEPARRVSSVMAMRHRQQSFFLSEEDDRIERLSVSSGDKNSSTSTRLLSTQRQLRPDLLSRLLDPAPEPRGVISNSSHHPHTAHLHPSLNRSFSQSSHTAKERVLFPTRGSSLSTHVSNANMPIRRAHSVNQSARDARKANESTQMKNSTDYIMEMHQLVDDLLHGTHDLGPNTTTHSSDTRPYADGAPALILPGGGRLPDKVRELIKSMVASLPEERPAASEVVSALRAEAASLVAQSL